MYYLFLKRSMDIFLSILGLILLAPLLILVSILIKIDDPRGNVIFKQTRVGKNEIKFNMYKFRSMVSNAEQLKASLINENEADGPVFKMKKDPRITKIGAFIRKTSIDELPQLINVIKGEMSLVGPRPPILEEVNQYSNYEKLRLRVLPGLTCYWQVGGRNDISFKEWIELDLKYITERNIFIDIKLIVKTITVLFGSKNAY
ncbi:sugar transferase [Halobacillus sp. BBL2006]|uniref:sugar transferase n=1 Tax=Halobacillus sp. BBL2006 TaxID=1543706 RepID=UPI0009DD136B|nr:sugar transferase [Halobacillus sp. BBL2006]